MGDFRAALPHLEQLKSQNAIWHREKLEDEKAIIIKDEVQKSQSGFRKLILILLICVLILGAIVSVVTFLYANRVKQTRDELQAQYDSSLACLKTQQYLCARDGFQKLLTSGEDFPDLANNLNLAQFGLAQQYFDSGQWENAVKELKILLQTDPGNKNAVDLLRTSYDRWIEQLGLEGKWIQRWMVGRERDARFPPGDK